MSFWKSKKININYNNLPKHIAFIVDGNGRWAKKLGMPRTYGHKVGLQTVKDTVLNCYDLGIKEVSFYCFSTENWNRPKAEIDAIFELIREYLQLDIEDYVKKGIRIYVSGDISPLPIDIQHQINNALERTKNGNNLLVNICLNYGGRAEIIRAVNNIIKDKKESITEDEFKNYLYTKDFHDPDLIVRTSGEHRISNFLLYQLAYAEFYFPKTYWPDFDKKELLKAIAEFQCRTRRFGAIKE